MVKAVLSAFPITGIALTLHTRSVLTCPGAFGILLRVCRPAWGISGPIAGTHNPCCSVFELLLHCSFTS